MGIQGLGMAMSSTERKDSVDDFHARHLLAKFINCLTSRRRKSQSCSVKWGFSYSRFSRLRSGKWTDERTVLFEKHPGSGFSEWPCRV